MRYTALDLKVKRVFLLATLATSFFSFTLSANTEQLSLRCTSTDSDDILVHIDLVGNIAFLSHPDSPAHEFQITEVTDYLISFQSVDMSDDGSKVSETNFSIYRYNLSFIGLMDFNDERYQDIWLRGDCIFEDF